MESYVIKWLWGWAFVCGLITLGELKMTNSSFGQYIFALITALFVWPICLVYFVLVQLGWFKTKP